MEEKKSVAIFPLKLVIWPNGLLNVKSFPVENFDDSVKHLVESMTMTMLLNRGYGLSAVQVGRLKRIMLCMVDGKPLTLINPIIKEQFGEAVNQEGCLSVPGFRTPIKRAEHIVVDYQGIDGNSVTLDTRALDFKINVLTPACIQHEIDHMEGIVFTKYVSELKRTFAKKEVAKYNRRLRTQNRG